MSDSNVQRLKKKAGLDGETPDVDKYFELIDKIYYEELAFIESFDGNTQTTTWLFEDKTIIQLDVEELLHLSLFLMNLSQDADEQHLDYVESYFLKDNEWQISK